MVGFLAPCLLLTPENRCQRRDRSSREARYRHHLIDYIRPQAGSSHRSRIGPVKMNANPSLGANNVDALAESFPCLRTSRLSLREIVPTDATSLLAIHGDREAMRWFGNDPIESLAEAEQLVKAFASLRKPLVQGIRWALVRERDGRFVGTCGLFRWNKKWKSCSIGYELTRDVWGGGLMAEALDACMVWGFQSMDLNRIEAQVHPKNAASLKLLKRLGFVEEGRQRQAGFWDSEHHDLLQLSMLRHEYSNEMSR